MNFFLLNTNRLTEIIEQAAKQSASALQEIVNQPVTLSFSKVKIINASKEKGLFEDLIEDPGAVIKLKYDGGLRGCAFLVLGNGSEKELLHGLLDEHINNDQSEESAEIIFYEIGNVLLNIYVGTIANQLNAKVEYAIPEVVTRQEKQGWLDDLLGCCIPPQKLLLLKSALGIGELEITADIIILIDYSEEVADKLC